MSHSEKAEVRYCRNCHYPLPAKADYCSHCSQKYTTGKVPVIQLIKDLVNHLFNLDSKFFSTLAALFIPARLTINYFKGRHQRYAVPLRVFVVTTLISIAIISIYVSRQDLVVSQFTREIDRYKKKQVINQIDTLSKEVLKSYPGGSSKKAVDHLLGLARDSMVVDSSDNFNFSTIKITSLLRDSIENIRFSAEDLLLSNEQLYEKYQVTQLIDQIFMRQILKFYRTGDASSYLQFLLGNTIWLMLLLIPSMALLLKLLHFWSSHYYVEHLVFLLHHHSFAFLLVGLSFLFQLIFASGFGIGLITLLIFAYLLIAMKRYYRESWKKTLAKYFIFNFVYAVLYIVFLALISVISFLLF